MCVCACTHQHLHRSQGDNNFVSSLLPLLHAWEGSNWGHQSCLMSHLATSYAFPSVLHCLNYCKRDIGSLKYNWRFGDWRDGSVLAALPEDRKSVSSTHIWLLPFINNSSVRSDALFWLPSTSTCHAHAHVGTWAHAIWINIEGNL